MALVVLGDGYDTFSPYDSPQRLINPLTNREDPPGLDTNDIGPNDSLAILIVKGTAPVIGSNPLCDFWKQYWSIALLLGACRMPLWR